jgi:uncharacterized membrane protein
VEGNVKTNNILLGVIIIVAIFLLTNFFITPMMGYGYYGMMGYNGYGIGSGFGGLWIFGFLFMALFLIILVLLIIWLIKQLEGNKKTPRRKNEKSKNNN